DALLRPVGIEVDDDDQRLALGGLGVGKQRIVLDRQEANVFEPLQGGVLTADLVERGGKPQQRAVQRAPLDLVYLGVEVLLGSGGGGDVLAVLKARVHAVARRQGGGEHEARRERRRAAGLQIVGENVRGVDEEVGPAVVRHA